LLWVLRKRTTDIKKMNREMKEINDWRKQYRGGFKKHDKVLIEELIKKRVYVNKMSMEMQQQQMCPMLIYKMPSFMLGLFVMPVILGATTSLTPIHISWIMYDDKNVRTDTQFDNIGQPKGSCIVSGQVFRWGRFLITSIAFSCVISKITKTSMPSLTRN
jgi:uncharacterized membrane protein (DUF106 family)